MIWVWLGFIAFVLLMLALDLGVFHRKAHVVEKSLSVDNIFVIAMIFTLLRGPTDLPASRAVLGHPGRAGPLQSDGNDGTPRFEDRFRGNQPLADEFRIGAASPPPVESVCRTRGRPKTI